MSCRRSAEELGAGDEVERSAAPATLDVDTPVAGVTRAAPVDMSTAPQSPQNFLPDGLSAPHAGQRKNSGAPQSPQTFLLSGLTLPQLGQSMPHPIEFI